MSEINFVQLIKYGHEVSSKTVVWGYAYILYLQINVYFWWTHHVVNQSELSIWCYKYDFEVDVSKCNLITIR